MSSSIILRFCNQLVIRPLIGNTHGLNNNLPKLYQQTRFAGHAKWQNIKGTKMANDMAKCKVISRYVQLVRRAIVTQNYQADPKLNSKLAGVLTEASKFNVPKATLERAIARAINIKLKQVNIEVQGPGSCSIVARCEVDNPALFRRDVKKVLKKHDAALLNDDTVINMFKSQGYIRAEMRTVDGRDINEDFAEEAAIMANAQEVTIEINEETTDENLAKLWVFSTDAETLNPCKGDLEKQGFKIVNYDLELVPYRSIDFGPGIHEKVLAVVKDLQELDQVLDVFHNSEEPSSEEVATSSS